MAGLWVHLEGRAKVELMKRMGFPRRQDHLLPRVGAQIQIGRALPFVTRMQVRLEFLRGLQVCLSLEWGGVS